MSKCSQSPPCFQSCHSKQTERKTHLLKRAVWTARLCTREAIHAKAASASCHDHWFEEEGKTMLTAGWARRLARADWEEWLRVRTVEGGWEGLGILITWGSVVRSMLGKVELTLTGSWDEGWPTSTRSGRGMSVISKSYLLQSNSVMKWATLVVGLLGATTAVGRPTFSPLRSILLATWGKLTSGWDTATLLTTCWLVASIVTAEPKFLARMPWLLTDGWPQAGDMTGTKFWAWLAADVPPDCWSETGIWGTNCFRGLTRSLGLRVLATWTVLCLLMAGARRLLLVRPSSLMAAAMVEVCCPCWGAVWDWRGEGWLPLQGVCPMLAMACCGRDSGLVMMSVSLVMSLILFRITAQEIDSIHWGVGGRHVTSSTSQSGNKSEIS